MTAQEAYILAKAYTNKSIEGAGSLKGAACQIKSIEAITGGHRITFEWEDNDGEVSTDTMDVMDGADGDDGVGISSIAYKETDAHGNYVYTVTLTDTNTYDIICPKGAQGETGETGNGIASIEKTGTSGNVDTYTITYTNGQTSTFTVTNGVNPTVDDAMSESSTNPVQNKVITAALALKQDKTDNTLQTTSKTVVGAVNELKSGLTNLDNEVNGDATVYPYADVITIPDAVPANLADCNVKIEPVQDLHGYDKPWVGGAGKNKIPMTVDGIKALNVYGTWSGNAYAYNGVTFTILTDNDGNVTGVSATGTASDSTNFIVAASSTTGIVDLLNGKSLIYNGCPSGGSEETYSLYGYHVTTSGGSVRDTGNGVTFDGIYSGSFNFSISVASGYTIPTGGLTFLPMIRLATETDATFAPYTNICPITGHTEASVQRDGKNLLDDSIVGLYQAASDPTVKRYGYAPFAIKAGVYTISYTNTQPTVKLYLTDMTDWTYVEIDASGTTVTIAKDTMVFLRSGLSTSEIDFRNNFFDTIVELGQTATHYEPYAGKTYTIALGDTIYGGTVDFDSGVMTVGRALVEYDGDSEENWSLDTSGENYFFTIELLNRDLAKVLIANNCENVAIAKGNTNIGVGGDARYLRYRYANDNSLTVSDLKTFLASNNLQVCYYLATPTTIQLTPQQIQLLKGHNTLTASTGQISVTVNGVSGAIGSLTSDKQDKTDYALETTAKTVVGAINEVSGNLSNLLKEQTETITADANGYLTTSLSAYRNMIIAVKDMLINEGNGTRPRPFLFDTLLFGGVGTNKICLRFREWDDTVIGANKSITVTYVYIAI